MVSRKPPGLMGKEWHRNCLCNTPGQQQEGILLRFIFYGRRSMGTRINMIDYVTMAGMLTIMVYLWLQ